ncbi:signal peptidase I [Agromyces humi]|uniref:signal peptidase I n=1 Tax=Agromyces humi TaxID=1766800 RepID=UPI001359E57E|nr:signal peptidase I [Agromyces humi]
MHELTVDAACLDGVSPQQPSSRREALRRDRAKRRARSVALHVATAVGAIVFAMLVRATVFEISVIPSTSMAPTLAVGDRVGVEKLTGNILDVKRGDIVTFRDPGGWLPDELSGPDPVTAVMIAVGLAPHDLGGQLIKRVVGLPGDRVACCTADGLLTVNGVPLEEPYLPASLEKASADGFAVVVPDGHLWVMGDNRDASADSRAHQDSKSGPFVPFEALEGRAIFRFFPLDRFGSLLD